MKRIFLAFAASVSFAIMFLHAFGMPADAQANGRSMVAGEAQVGTANQSALVHVCASCAYTDLAPAIASLGPSGGMVILDGGYTDTITSTLQVGPANGPGIKVFMAPGSEILENISDGSPGIQIGEGSALECMGAGVSGSVNGLLRTSPCQIVAANSANMSTMLTSSIQLINNMQDVFDVVGITFVPLGANIRDAVMDVAGVTTPSLVANNNLFGGPNVRHVLHISYGTGGGKIFINNEVRGGSEGTGSEVYITGADGNWNLHNQQLTSAELDGGEISCRNGAYPAIQIDGDPTGSGNVGIQHLIFDNVWSQDCEASSSAPYITINNAAYVTFRDMQFGTSTDAPIVAVTENTSAGNGTSSIQFDNVTVSCPNPNCSGTPIWIQDTTAQGFTHPTPQATNSLAHGGNWFQVNHDEAGRWASSSGAAWSVSSRTDTPVLEGNGLKLQAETPFAPDAGHLLCDDGNGNTSHCTPGSITMGSVASGLTVTCQSGFVCNNRMGQYRITSSTFTTGPMFTLRWAPTNEARQCVVHAGDTPVWLNITDSTPSSDSVTFYANSSIAGARFLLAYRCEGMNGEY